MRLVDDIAARPKMDIAAPNTPAPHVVERLVTAPSALDAISVDQVLRQAHGEDTAVAGAGIVMGVLWGGVSWMVFLAGFAWFLFR